MILHYNNNL